MVCKKEGIKVSDEIIDAISLTCDGSPRAAIVSLEQVAGIDDVDTAIEVLVKGTSKDSNVIELCKLLLASQEVRHKKWKQILEVFTKIDAENETIRRSILTFIFNKLTRCDDELQAKDLAKLLDIFSISTYYGGKSQLGALIVRACLGE
jgi:hypothetical protein